jgi:hypothetical protein
MRYVKAEAAMRSTVWLELPAYNIANAATEALLWVIQRSGFDGHDGDDDPPASYWRAKALLYLGVLAVRITRAAMAVIASGYEQEAMTYKRALMEVHSRAQRVVADQSGSYAREWLRGRAGKPAKAVGAYSPEDLWEMLSHSSHADHRAVENFLAISNDDGTTSLLTTPERRVEVSNSTLAAFAGETRDVAMVLAAEHGLTIPNLAHLDAAIAAQPLWRDEAAENEKAAAETTEAPTDRATVALHADSPNAKTDAADAEGTDSADVERDAADADGDDGEAQRE